MGASTAVTDRIAVLEYRKLTFPGGSDTAGGGVGVEVMRVPCSCDNDAGPDSRVRVDRLVQCRTGIW